jgi:hypothetical protein
MFINIASAAVKYTELKETLPGGANDLLGIIDRVTNWFFTILLVLAVIFIIFAAYKYLMSGGGEEVGKAHKMVLYAAVAVAVAVLAKGVVNVTKVLIGGSSQTTQGDAYKQISTSPDISVWPCENGSVSNVMIGDEIYAGTGNQMENGSYKQISTSPNISVWPCEGGTIPNVMLDEEIYSYSKNPVNTPDTTSNTTVEEEPPALQEYSPEYESADIKDGNTANLNERVLRDFRLVNGPSTNIFIEDCSDGKLAGIRYNRVFYGDNPNIPLDSKSSPNAGGFETIKLPSGIQFSVEICNDGFRPKARIDNVLY